MVALIFIGTILFVSPAKIDAQPVINDPGFTVNGSPMAKIDGAYLLCINGDPDTNYYIQYAGDLAPDNDLQCEKFPLTLIDSTVASEDLEDYYNSRTTLPGDYRDYLIDAAYGIEPFAYVDGGTELLVDAAQYDLQCNTNPMTIPGDYPTGTYTVRGYLYDLDGFYTVVTYKLKISRCLPGEEEVVKPWVRGDRNMVCYQVWVNDDDCFEFVFWYEYKDNNWVKIYDMAGNEVFSVDMAYGKANFTACLADGMYTVKTFHVDMSEPLQEFVIAK
jgi:hypothetical protein